MVPPATEIDGVMSGYEFGKRHRSELNIRSRARQYT